MDDQALIRAMEHTAMEHCLWQAGETIIVAVSGGPDSVALLHLLQRIAPNDGLRLVAAHVNHGFRGEESDREAELVQALCRELDVPCETAVIDMPGYIAATGLNAQAAAREKRYAFLHQIASRHGAKRIALAHHADDQAETVLMRIVRGTGPSGLAGIPVRRTEKNTELIRPLLRIYKMDLVNYCLRHALPYATDSSNASRKYARNRIRLDALPFLRQYNDQLPQALNRLAELARGEDDYLEQEAAGWFAKLAQPDQSGVGFVLDRGAFVQLHVALQRRLIKLILNYLSPENDSIDFGMTETVREAMVHEHPATLSLDVEKRVRFVREYDRLRFVGSKAEAAGPYCYMLDGPGTELLIHEAGVIVTCSLEDSGKMSSGREIGPGEALFDADALLFPLTIRNRRDGDRMKIAGLNGTKKVKDIFIDDKIPPSRRDKIAIVLDAEHNIVWIPGVRRSQYAPVCETSKRIARILIQRFEAGIGLSSQDADIPST